MNTFQSQREFLVTDGVGGFFCHTESLSTDRKWHGWWQAMGSPRNRQRFVSGVEVEGKLADGSHFHTSLWKNAEWSKPSELPELQVISASCFCLNYTRSGVRLFFSVSESSFSISATGTEMVESLRLRPLFPREVSFSKERDGGRFSHGSEPLPDMVFDIVGGSIENEHDEESDDRFLSWETQCETTHCEPVFYGPSVLVKGPKLYGALVFSTSGTQDYDVVLPNVKSVQPVTDSEELLKIATEQFIVKTPTNRSTILAGYPWFTDWGRDTMIALPSLCLLLGRFAEAADIIDHFLEYEKNGLIPNLFPEGNEEPRYNTIDGTLWMFHAIDQYLKSAPDATQKKTAWLGKLNAIIEHHVKGTENSISVDGDGLLRGGSSGTQLTWMDIKVNGHVPTPRHGKPVEIQGLWANALAVTAALNEEADNTDLANEQLALLGKCRDSFAKRFVSEKYAHLADVVDRDGDNTADWELRPNMVIPFALSENIIPEFKRVDVLKAVSKYLLTPRGLRTVSPESDFYHGTYIGHVEDRDLAYHQGTAWMWLLIPYAKGVMDYRNEVPELADELSSIAKEILHQHRFGECCFNQANEIFDGDSPNQSRGCFAQAWSTAALVELSLL